MDSQSQQSLWQQFCNSGAIRDYLAYRQEMAAEELNDEVLHSRPDYSGTTRGRE